MNILTNNYYIINIDYLQIDVDTDIGENTEIHPTITDNNMVIIDEHNFHNIGSGESVKNNKITTTHEAVKTFLSQAFK